MNLCHDIGDAKDDPKIKKRLIFYRIIPEVTASVTFGFSRQKAPLLSGSRYFRMVKRRLHGAVIYSIF